MIIIDEIEDTSINELCLLYLLKQNKLKETMKSLSEKGYFRNGVTSSGEIEMKLGIKHKKTDTDTIRNLASNYRKLFRGKKPGVMSSMEACMLVLREFKQTYDYTDEEILKAAENYVKSQIKNGYEYLQRADRVVYNVENGVPVSKLLAFCDELELENNGGEEEWTDII
jgi:hypothetical protein